MKNYFFIGLLLISFNSISSVGGCVPNAFLKLQEDTWPLRGQLETIKKYFARTKPCLTTEQHEKFKWHHHTTTKSLDHVIAQCDHARMDVAKDNFSKLDEYLEKGQAHFKQATIELTDYKLALKNTLGIDIDTQAKL